MSDNERVIDWNAIQEDDRDYEYIPVAVWKGQARVQSLNAKELTDVIDHAGGNVGYKLIAMCLVDMTGRQVFRLPDEPVLVVKDPASPDGEATNARLDAAVERVKQKNPKAIGELAKALMTMNGLTAKTSEAVAQATDVKNDSGEAPTVASPIA